MFGHLNSFYHDILYIILSRSAFWKKISNSLCCSSLILKQTNCLDIHSFLGIYFITISRLKFAKILEYFMKKAEAEISKRIDIILCVRASVTTMQFYDITVLSDYTQLPLTYCS